MLLSTANREKISSEHFISIHFIAKNELLKRGGREFVFFLRFKKGFTRGHQLNRRFSALETFFSIIGKRGHTSVRLSFKQSACCISDSSEYLSVPFAVCVQHKPFTFGFLSILVFCATDAG